MSRKYNITQARSRLLELARFLEANPDEVVLLEHRDLDETLVLTTAKHLKRLEQLVSQTRKLAPGRFKMAGSAQLKVTEDELEAGIAEARRTQAALVEAKMSALSRELRSED